MTVAASGLFFAAKARPQASRAADGQFCLQWLAYDRQGAHKVIPWRFLWSGPAAEAWWKVHGDRIAPGVPMEITAHSLDVLRPLGCQCEIHARVTAAPQVLPGRWCHEAGRRVGAEGTEGVQA